MSNSGIELGRRGEQIAVSFLKDKGYKIVSINYRTKLGQIDIVARENKTICFVEVKTRKTSRFGKPIDAVGYFKQRKISQVALMFLKENKLLDSQARFDIISIVYPGKIELIKNAFELDQHYLY
ncbi:MAG: YraN family protein [Candidatus Omnitrophota bacterium]